MKYVALLTLGCFSVLMSYCYGTTAPYRPVHTVEAMPTGEVDMAFGYTKADLKKLKAIWKPKSRDDRAREVVLYRAAPKPTAKAALKRKQAEVYAMVYGITDQNIDSYKEW